MVTFPSWCQRCLRSFCSRNFTYASRRKDDNWRVLVLAAVRGALIGSAGSEVVNGGWGVFVLFVVLTLVPTPPVRADVVVYGRTESSLFVDISGTITNLDSKTFESAIQDLGGRRLYTRLDSV